MGSGQVLKKSPFGGFKKEGVLDYIEQLEGELRDARVASPLTAAQERSAVHSIAEREVVELEAQITELEDEKVLAQKEIKKLTAAVSEYSGLIKAYEQKIAEYSKGQEKLAQTDEQIGNLVTDAVIYSETLMSRARSNSRAVAAKAKGLTDSASAEIAAVQSEVVKLRDEFAGAFDLLSERLDEISQKMVSLTEKYFSEPENPYAK